MWHVVWCLALWQHPVIFRTRGVGFSREASKRIGAAAAARRTMARRYDSRTTIFSPEGRLYQVRTARGQSSRCLTPSCCQVEYAIEAISHAGSTVGILAKEGVVLAAEKKILSKVCSPARPAAAPASAAPPPPHRNHIAARPQTRRHTGGRNVVRPSGRATLTHPARRTAAGGEQEG